MSNYHQIKATIALYQAVTVDYTRVMSTTTTTISRRRYQKLRKGTISRKDSRGRYFVISTSRRQACDMPELRQHILILAGGWSTAPNTSDGAIRTWWQSTMDASG